MLLKNITVFVAIHLKCSAHSNVVLDDSLITVNTTSFDQHKVYCCTMALDRCEISDDVMVLIWKFAWHMPMNDMKKELVFRY